MDWERFCYIHKGGQLIKGNDACVEYKGGYTNAIIMNEDISYEEFNSKVCVELNIDPTSFKFEFIVKFDLILSATFAWWCIHH